jgi:hypothetical protein
VLYSRGTDNAENTVLLLRSADYTENTSHMIAKHCWSVKSLGLRGSEFTEPLPRSGLHDPVVPFLRACYCLVTTVSVAQPFLHGVNRPHYIHGRDENISVDLRFPQLSP